MVSPDKRPGTQGPSASAHAHDSQVPRKRPGSWDNNPSTAGNRPVKKRAVRACVSCRDRKVRCDVVNGGPPCTNCRLDDVDCVLKASNRGKHNPARHPARSSLSSNATAPRAPSPSDNINTDADTAAPGPAPGSAPATVFRSDHGHGSVATGQPQERRGGQSVAHGDEETICDDGADENNSWHNQQEAEQTRIIHDTQVQPNGIVDETHCEQQPQPQPSQGAATRSTPSAQPANPQTSDYLVALAFQGFYALGWTEQDTAEAPPSSSKMDNVSASANTPHADQNHLPLYISPHPSHLDNHDLEFLARKDCFTIPDNQLRDELIRIYVFVVYPFMPAIDLADFLEPITGSSEVGTVSLLLFQAIMFASVTFIDMQLLQRYGFKNKRAARQVFFNRVKLLYSLGYEADRLTLVQSLLLMTYWYDSDSDEKHTWYWMGLALTTAHIEGLHRDLEEPQQMTKNGRLRRRIWWSCVIRDRLLGLGLRRPSRIQEDEFSVERLRLDDFDISLPPPPAVARLLAAPSYTGKDPVNRQRIANLCIDLSQLCFTIGRILHTQYTIASTPGAGSNYLRRAIVRPRSLKEQAHSFAKCDADLQEWFQSLAPESRYVPGARDGGAAAAQVENSTIRLHKILLYMKYLTAIGALHRPQVFYSGSDSIDPARKADSRRKLTEAAVAITKLAFDLQFSGLMCYAPTSSVPAFLSAALIHLLNIRSPDEETRNISIGRFCQCLDALHQLQSMYTAADEAVHIINNMTENAGFILPLLSIGNPMSKANGIAARNSRLFSEIGPSRVTTAYPSPAPGTGNLDTSQEEMISAPIPGAGPTGVALSGHRSRQPSAGPNMTSSATPNLMSIWSAAGNIHSERDIPLPADLMAGIQLDLDAWYNIGDIIDPALMNFETGLDFLSS
ncbi:cutinase transcription factor 1 beta [Fusarium subglutinans]|uniref:Cutinase transcription factor 1 beta n=1 Tax=Gibberella subglutinans TaxID=42677 RepID=A0A8H5KQU1_GIBSU|nr:cutinase transcription factor 1 beta [Fusarium subglutinans]KAF5578820.1 cutinase transcription factor 1 beta [Fusarium subglutinans]